MWVRPTVTIQSCTTVPSPIVPNPLDWAQNYEIHSWHGEQDRAIAWALRPAQWHKDVRTVVSSRWRTWSLSTMRLVCLWMWRARVDIDCSPFLPSPPVVCDMRGRRVEGEPDVRGVLLHLPLRRWRPQSMTGRRPSMLHRFYKWRSTSNSQASPRTRLPPAASAPSRTTHGCGVTNVLSSDSHNAFDCDGIIKLYCTRYMSAEYKKRTQERADREWREGGGAFWLILRADLHLCD